MRLKLLLPDVKATEFTQPKKCRRAWCAGMRFYPRQIIQKKIVDTQYKEVSAWRIELWIRILWRLNVNRTQRYLSLSPVSWSPNRKLLLIDLEQRENRRVPLLDDGRRLYLPDDLIPQIVPGKIAELGIRQNLRQRKRP